MPENKPSVPQLTPTEILSYIRIQWADIHYGYLLELSALAVIVIAVYALIHLPSDMQTGVIFGALGILSALLGAGLSLRQQVSLDDKIKLITGLEQKIGIVYPARQSRFSAQFMIYLLYAGIATSFTTLTAFWIFASEPIAASHPTGFAALTGLVFLVALLLLGLGFRRRRMQGEH